ncbi:uncharacterized protein LOC118202295 [Stegodyphus dumicola]|uniref:uncharacterized protein LOC118202295 n=1 Tax=Stegodyphus dumicola TaxID=202533 RepID=UPI0015AF244D|nr:uncharacterized protein LOC118202295 [Stegodyphus dumicola]
MFTFTCVFVSVTILLTSLATLFLTLSLFSNEWEYISYEMQKVDEIVQSKNYSIQWLLGQMARIEVDDASTEKSVQNNRSEMALNRRLIYLVPAYGGVNKLCIDIPDVAWQQMKEDGFLVEECISYLSKEKVTSRDSWLDRMRNLAMSCAIVCLILLGSSAALGILGLIKNEISTIMVTGVMYSLAAVFGTFNLVFMRFKRVKPDGFYTSTVLDKDIPEEFLRARLFTVGWPPAIECAGLCLCVIASLFWLLLARIFRFLIISTT